LFQVAVFTYTEYQTLNNQQRSNTMADTPTKVIVDCSTGITEVLPLTAQEIADMETARVAAEAERVEREAEQAANAILKAEILDRLGITEAEAKLLLS